MKGEAWLDNIWDLLLHLSWLVILLLFLHRYLKEMLLIHAVQSWSETDGEITQCEIIDNGFGFWLEVSYQYQVFDCIYHGTNVCVPQFFITPFSPYVKRTSFAIAMAYQRHERVPVYYDPRSPSDAVLAKPRPVRLAVIVTLLLFFTIFHLVLLFSRLSLG